MNNPQLPGVHASGNPPFFNIASMKNWGIDVAVTQSGQIGGAQGLQFDATLTFTSYRNTITSEANGVTYFDQDFGEKAVLEEHLPGMP